jgi:hypothetical protein
VFFHLAADALNWCVASQADPLPLERLRERFLPECAFRGRENTKLQYAVLAAAALRGGTEPDLLDEVARWQTDEFWQYALFAARSGYPAAAVSRSPSGPAIAMAMPGTSRLVIWRSRPVTLASGMVPPGHPPVWVAPNTLVGGRGGGWQVTRVRRSSFTCATAAVIWETRTSQPPLP